jgi:hypothetical protein
LAPKHASFIVTISLETPTLQDADTLNLEVSYWNKQYQIRDNLIQLTDRSSSTNRILRSLKITTKTQKITTIIPVIQELKLSNHSAPTALSGETQPKTRSFNLS